ncbi:exopolysaccharide Pel transporter PelG [Brevibacillus humidisoli]|uniref:exopolysaccharide Pel transporter PelG n=1 Tax=Brevibacillus humidisoli TaxID=2895522 RepID=UPI001E616477|nr:exopolysaccharide Pel transporter PelG [Brevibacillus humidisoli]UFJ41050.1 exopolysaccharide Pel transporter PelG [Brevibacillus humidisoli]
MAGIGFQLKRLFEREGLMGQIQAISYASLVTVGPMLSCIIAVAIIHWMLVSDNAPYVSREVFTAGIAYAFAFSFVITSPFSMFLTRLASDLLYEKRYDQLLPTFYRYLRITLLFGCVPALLFVWWTPLSIAEKVSLFVLYMELNLVWIEVVYVSAMKAYRSIAYSFLGGMTLAVALVWIYMEWAGAAVSAAGLLTMMAAGFFLIAATLLRAIERFFRTPESPALPPLRQDLQRYPSLLGIGLFTGLCMFWHQFAQWIFHGTWLADAFLVKPEYDVAVFYAVLSVLPTLVWFVVSVETSFYPKFRQYYDAILGKGTILDIDRARQEMHKVLIGELGKLMGIQLVFSLISVACGIRFLPYIGFTAQQVDTFNILVMAFYVYVMTSVVLLLLLYFDDRLGALSLSALFFAANLAASWLLRDEQYQGLPLFVASFPVLAVTLGRLVYRLRRLHYATFSAQPLHNRKRKLEQKRESAG